MIGGFDMSVSTFVNLAIGLLAAAGLASGLVVGLSRPTPPTAGETVLLAAVSLVAGGVPLWLLRKPFGTRVNALLVVASVGLAAAVLEAVVANSDHLRWVVFDVVRGEDTRLGERVVMDLRRDNRQAYSAIPPILLPDFDIDGRRVAPLTPLGGKLSVLCNEGEGWIVYRSDRYGFRNPDEVWQHPAHEIVAVGDSFTQGSCVEAGYVERLRETFSSTVNLASRGNGPLRNLATLIEYLPTLRARKVLWFHFEGNDLADLQDELANPVLARYLEDGFRQGLPELKPRIDEKILEFHERKLKQTLADDPLRRSKTQVRPLTGFTDYLLLRNLRNALGLQILGTLPAAGHEVPGIEPGPQMLEAFETVLNTARRVAEANGAQLILVYVPDRRSLKDPGRDDRFVRKRVLGIAADSAIAAIDLYPRLAETDIDTLYNFPLAHFNSTGAQAVADIVVRSLAASSPGVENTAGD